MTYLATESTPVDVGFLQVGSSSVAPFHIPSRMPPMYNIGVYTVLTLLNVLNKPAK